MTHVGKPIDRVDGRLKVTGAARYAAEFQFENLAHAVLLKSMIAKGHITAINTTEAEAAPGVIAVITHLNAPRLNPYMEGGHVRVKPGEKFVPLQSNEVYYDAQTIGIVVAETFEQARHAVDLVQVTYEQEPAIASLEQGLSQAYQPAQFYGEELQIQRGDIESAISQAEVQIDATYTTPIEHHNPMEPTAAIAVWEGDNLTIHDSTQWVIGTQQVVAVPWVFPTRMFAFYRRLWAVDLAVKAGFGGILS